MLSLAECKKILNTGQRNYSEEEAKAIRDLLFQLAEIDLENFKKYLNEKEGSTLHKSID